MLSYAPGMIMSNRALTMLTDLLRHNRTTLRTRLRKLEPGRHAHRPTTLSQPW